jgi:hypothetical protein
VGYFFCFSRNIRSPTVYMAWVPAGLSPSPQSSMVVLASAGFSAHQIVQLASTRQV